MREGGYGLQLRALLTSQAPANGPSISYNTRLGSLTIHCLKKIETLTPTSVNHLSYYVLFAK